jgi:shikimate dehydrogenase
MQSSSAKVFGVIGDPVSHSLSPIMHNAALAHLTLPYIYVAFPVKKRKLGDFLGSLPHRNIAGLNVTIPHKQEIIPYMDSLTREAKLIGAVNTILIRKNKLIGDNTDGNGYWLSLKKEANFNVKGKRIILLGAGGAARAIAITLGLRRARKVLIVNRTIKKAIDLACECNQEFRETTFITSTFNTIKPKRLKKANLLINATSLGMKKVKEFPLDLRRINPRALVSDIVYTPMETPLLKQAKKLKLKTHAGWGMLLYQGALAFEKWTGKKAPVKVMKEALLSALGSEV